MNRRRCIAGLSATAAIAGWIASGCGGDSDPVEPPPPPSACVDSVTVTVSYSDTVPIISWTPDCTIGRMLIEEGIDEYWGTETFGENIYRSPITYGINPPGTAPEEPARPLEIGHTYRISMFRWITYAPVESTQAVSRHMFTYEPPGHPVRTPDRFPEHLRSIR
jgi:hypothetical protein